MSFVLARNLPIGKVEASIAMAWKHGVEWIIMTTWNNSYLKVNESLHIVPLKIVEIIQTGATGPLDIVLVCKKLGHCRNINTLIIYNYIYLWCKSPRQFDFCSLILFLKYVPKTIWIKRRSPIASPSSMWTPTLKGTVKLQTVPCVFECHCWQYYIARYTCVHIVCTNANMCACFCLLHLCDRCRCNHIEDGTTESETFWGGSVLIFKMLNFNGRKENVISRAAKLSFWCQ